MTLYKVYYSIEIYRKFLYLRILCVLWPNKNSSEQLDSVQTSKKHKRSLFKEKALQFLHCSSSHSFFFDDKAFSSSVLEPGEYLNYQFRECSHIVSENVRKSLESVQQILATTTTTMYRGCGR